jgi:hypothetical protein
MKLIMVVLMAGLVGCASSMSNVNRRPFMDKMGLVAFTKKGLAAAKSVGVKKYDYCTRRWQFGFFMTGDDPNYNELSEIIGKEHQIKYMTNVKSIEYGESGFLLGKTCIGLEGEAWK